MKLDLEASKIKVDHTSILYLTALEQIALFYSSSFDYWSVMQVEEDIRNGVVGAVPDVPSDAGKEEVISSLVANVESMIKADRKITSLKQLQVPFISLPRAGNIYVFFHGVIFLWLIPGSYMEDWI